MPCLIFILWTVLLLCTGCSAPHDNPLDPESDYFVPPASVPAEPVFFPRVVSIHVSRIFPTTDTYHVVAELSSDSIITIDSASVSYDSLNPVVLSFTSDLTWATIFSSTYFNDPRLGSVIGVPFYFYCRDLDENFYSLDPVYLFRVIESTPRVNEPDSNDFTPPFVTLSWQSFSASFPFSFRCSLYRVLANFESNIWNSELLSPNQLEIAVSDSLDDGDYYWTLTVEDAFGNSSRSKEGRFIVLAGIP